MTNRTIDRRGFLKSGGLIAAGFAAGSLCMWKPEKTPGSTASTPPRRPDLSKGTPSMSDLAKSHFDGCLGQQFTIEHEGGKCAAKLTEVDGKTLDKVESFCLIFEVPGTEVLPQSIRKVTHPQVGSHDIFLVPVGNDGKATQYEAVFTRLIKENGDV